MCVCVCVYSTIPSLSCNVQSFWLERLGPRQGSVLAVDLWHEGRAALYDLISGVCAEPAKARWGSPDIAAAQVHSLKPIVRELDKTGSSGSNTKPNVGALIIGMGFWGFLSIIVL